MDAFSKALEESHEDVPPEELFAGLQPLVEKLIKKMSEDERDAKRFRQISGLGEARFMQALWNTEEVM